MESFLLSFITFLIVSADVHGQYTVDGTQSVRSLLPFAGIQSRGSADVNLLSGSVDSATIEASKPELIQYITTAVDAQGILQIYPNFPRFYPRSFQQS